VFIKRSSVWRIVICAMMGFFMVRALPAVDQQQPTMAITASPSPVVVKQEKKTETRETNWWEVATAIGTVAAAWFAYMATRQANQMAKQTEQTARAQRLAALWPDLSKLSFLNDDQKKRLDGQEVADLVLANVNAMEKIGLWWHADIVDSTTLAGELGKNFVLLYEQLIALGTLDKLNCTAEDLILRENQFIKPLYDFMKKYLDEEKGKSGKP